MTKHFDKYVKFQLSYKFPIQVTKTRLIEENQIFFIYFPSFFGQLIASNQLDPCFNVPELISEDIKRDTKRNKALSPFTQVLIFLQYVASGSFQQVVRDTIGVDKSTVS